MIGPMKCRTSAKVAMQQLSGVVQADPPGRGDIDGTCGIRVVESRPDCIYGPFRSLTYGFIDDVDFAMGGGSSSGGEGPICEWAGFLNTCVNG